MGAVRLVFHAELRRPWRSGLAMASGGGCHLFANCNAVTPALAATRSKPGRLPPSAPNECSMNRPGFRKATITRAPRYRRHRANMARQHQGSPVEVSPFPLGGFRNWVWCLALR